MNTGKISQNRLRRSVLKKITYQSENVKTSPDVGRDGSRFSLEGMRELVFTANPVTGTDALLGQRAFYRIVNDIVCTGASPVGITVQIFLPEGSDENIIKGLMEQIGNLAKEHHVDILGGHTQVMCEVTQPMLALTGIGVLEPETHVDSSNLKAGMSLVMTKGAGMAAAALLAREQRDKLRSRLPEDLLERAASLSHETSCMAAAQIAMEAGVKALHNVSTGGVFGALWEMAEASGTGLCVDLKAIPIWQETVEICEFFDINPYLSDSEGVLLAGTEDGEKLVELLTNAGIPAAVIGRVTADHDRVICNGDERRFLVPSGI